MFLGSDGLGVCGISRETVTVVVVPKIFYNCRNVGFMGVRSRVLRNLTDLWEPFLGPMGPQEVKNRSLGILGGVWTPISGLPYLSFVPS